jgi:hypothetical protein
MASNFNTEENGETGYHIIKNGEKYPIFYSYEMDESNFTVYGILPEEYPTTKLMAKSESNQFSTYKNQVFYLNIFVRPDELYIASFYVFPAVYKSVSLKEELDGTKGIGKDLLCKSINLCIELYGYKDQISLTSSAELINPVTYGVSYEEAMQFFKENHPKTYVILKEEYEEDLISKKDIVSRYFKVLENYKLVDYYKTYGFVITNDKNGNSIEMEADTKDVLKNCKTTRSYNMKKTRINSRKY